MLQNQTNSDSVRSYSEFLSKYFPIKAQELRHLDQVEPYELGKDAAARSLEEIGLESVSRHLSTAPKEEN